MSRAADRHQPGETRAAASFAGLCTLGAAGLAAAVAALAARAPAGAAVLADALRGIRADLLLEAVDLLARTAYGLLAAWTGYVWLHHARSRCRLTRTEVAVRTGVLVRRDVTVPLAAIRKLEVRRSAAGLLLGYGDLLVDDGSARPVVAWHVPDPDRWVEAIRAAQDAAAGGGIH